MQNHHQSRSYGSPGMNVLFNLCFLGVPYLWLRLYGRFFFVYGLVGLLAVAVALFATFAQSLASLLLVPLGLLLLSIGTTIDVYVQTKKFDDGRAAFPERNVVLERIGIGIFIVIIACALFSSADDSRPTASGSDKRVDQIAADFPRKRDAHCDAFETDPRLMVRSYYTKSITDYCYFKKAVTTKDPKYCYENRETHSFDDYCLGYLAYLNQTPEICTQMSRYPTLCEYAYEQQKPMISYPCNLSKAKLPNEEAVIRDLCLNEFADFYSSLPSSP